MLPDPTANGLSTIGQAHQLPSPQESSPTQWINQSQKMPNLPPTTRSSWWFRSCIWPTIMDPHHGLDKTKLGPSICPHHPSKLTSSTSPHWPKSLRHCLQPQCRLIFQTGQASPQLWPRLQLRCWLQDLRHLQTGGLQQKGWLNLSHWPMDQTQVWRLQRDPRQCFQTSWLPRIKQSRDWFLYSIGYRSLLQWCPRQWWPPRCLQRPPWCLQRPPQWPRRAPTPSHPAKTSLKDSSLLKKTLRQRLNSKVRETQNEKRQCNQNFLELRKIEFYFWQK